MYWVNAFHCGTKIPYLTYLIFMMMWVFSFDKSYAINEFLIFYPLTGILIIFLLKKVFPHTQPLAV